MKSIKGKIKGLMFVFASIFKWKRIVPVVTIKETYNLLTGKVALITGGSGGIGFAIAKKFISSGCKVILSGTNETKLQHLVNELGPGSCSYIIIEINKIDSFQDKIIEASKIFGKIDIFVNCHGVHTKRNDLDFLNITENEYDKVMNINLKGTYFICQKIASYMISKSIKGHILIISSQSALEPSWSPYRLSKRGISGITEGIAKKLLPYGIIVNAIGPGPTATTMQDDLIRGSIFTPDNPIGRYTIPDEIAEYAKLLVSNLGDSIVGQTIYMSGGRGIIDIK
jgi:NAD(P)-dependent dehydrogenase (short-subunit alcohol dehydrogenase family)